MDIDKDARIASLEQALEWERNRKVLYSDLMQKAQRARALWEGKFRIVKNENNKLRAALYAKERKDRIQALLEYCEFVGTPASFFREIRLQTDGGERVGEDSGEPVQPGRGEGDSQ